MCGDERTSFKHVSRMSSAAVNQPCVSRLSHTNGLSEACLGHVFLDNLGVRFKPGKSISFCLPVWCFVEHM